MPFDVSELRTEAGHSLDEADPSEIIEKPNGSKVFGVIDSNTAKIAGIPEGDILIDVKGLRHISWGDHKQQILNAGYPNVETFLFDVLGNYDRIYTGSHDSLLLAKHLTKNNGVSAIELMPNEEGTYLVQTGWIVRDRGLKNKKLLFSRSESLDTVPASGEVSQLSLSNTGKNNSNALLNSNERSLTPDNTFVNSNSESYGQTAPNQQDKSMPIPIWAKDLDNALGIARRQLNAVAQKYRGTDQWLKAPNGKKSNLTEKQWLQVRTPNFKRWFGDWENDPTNASKILDKNGEPMVVYHGTDHYGFSAFNTDGYGSFFSSNKDVVRTYISDNDDSKIYAVFLNLRNPYIVEAGGAFYDEIPAYVAKNESEPDEDDENYEDALETWNADNISVAVRNGRLWDKKHDRKHEKTHDGVIIRDIVDTATNYSLADFGVDPNDLFNEHSHFDKEKFDKKYTGDDFIVFIPNTIKSATDNNGMFSDSNEIHNQFVGMKATERLAEKGLIAQSTGTNETLETAKSLDAKHMPASFIWKQTGWVKGKDGQWRTEIPDGSIYNDFWQHPKSRIVKLQDFYNNDVLYAAYPELADMPLIIRKLVKYGGFYNPRSKAITVDQTGLENDDHETLHGTLLHEIQHAIQHIEGWQHGGVFSNKAANIWKEIERQIDSLPYDPEQGIDWQEDVFAAYTEAMSSDDQTKINEIVNRMNKDQKYVWKNVAKLIPKFIEARTPYHNNAGEVEARNAGRRVDFDMDKRRNTPPTLTEDVPRSKQLLTGSRNTIASSDNDSFLTPERYDQIVYHGTKNILSNNEFNLDYVGTGEGAQAYGYGVYTAQSRIVAESYRRAGLKGKEAENRDGNLYLVDNPENDVLLNWDLPLSQQPESVKKSIESMLDELPNIKWYFTRENILELPKVRHKNTFLGIDVRDVDSDDITGGILYQNIYDAIRGESVTDEEAAVKTSKLFNDFGIPGHRFLDQNSRNIDSIKLVYPNYKPSEKTYNFVIWNTDTLKLLGLTEDSEQDAKDYYDAEEYRKDYLDSLDNDSDVQDYTKGDYMADMSHIDDIANAHADALDNVPDSEVYGQTAQNPDTSLNLEDEAWNDTVDRFMNGEIKRNKEGNLLHVMNTPEVFTLIGMDRLPIEIHASNMNKILFKKHHIAPETLKQIPKALANPVMIFKSQHDISKERDSRVILTELKEKDAQGKERHVMAAITLGKNNLSKGYAINELTTVYRKDTSSKQQLTPEEDIYDWITRTFKDGTPMNLLLYVNKEKARQGAMSPGIKPLVFDILDGLPDSIPDEHDLARLLSQNRSESYPDSEMYNQIIGVKGARWLDMLEDVTTRMDNLNVARQMERKGLPVKKIWAATGWTRGKDNKWRSEIPDGKIIRRNLDELNKNDQRFQVLCNIADDNITPEQEEEFDRLEKMVYVKLPTIFDAPELYAAYPDLRNTHVAINNELGGIAMYYPDLDSIDINAEDEVFNDARNLRKTLIHEIQHAIQAREGFAGGSNYSLERDTKYNRYVNQYKSFMTKLDNDTANKIMDVMAISDEDEKRSILQTFSNKQLDAYEHAERLIQNAFDRHDSLSSRYLRHAGETESRNAETRAYWGEKRRKNTPLDASEDVPRNKQIVGKLLRQSSKRDNNTSEIYSQTAQSENPDDSAIRSADDFLTTEARQQMNTVRQQYEGTAMWLKAPNGKDSNLDEHQWLAVRTPNFKRWFGDWEAAYIVKSVKDFLENSEAVGSISGNEFQKSDIPLVDRVMEFYKNTGNTIVHNKELGDVKLDRRGIRDSTAHGLGKEKSAAFALVPDVIKNGFIYDRQNNWKGRGYDTVTLIANVKIGGQDYVCEVIVKQSRNKQGFYLHEVEIKENLDDVFKTALNNDGTPSRSRLIISQYAKEANNASKIVDENGEPLVVWHGTSENFSVFDSTKGRPNIDIQGMFFSPDKTDAGDYGKNLRAFFLNIKNPASQSQGYAALHKFKGQNYAGVKAREHLISQGFDGVNNSNEEFIAFYPEQIKSATDNNGTFDSRNPEVYHQTTPVNASSNDSDNDNDLTPNLKTNEDIRNYVKTLHDNPFVESYSQTRSFDDFEAERLYRKSYGKQSPKKTEAAIKRTGKDFIKGFKGDFPLLAGKEAREKGFTAAREILRIMNRNTEAKAHITMASLYDSLHGLDSDQFEIFSRMMILNDIHTFMMNNPEATELPLGYNRKELTADWQKYKNLAQQDKKVLKAILTEYDNNNKARNDLINIAEKLGLSSLAGKIKSADLFLVQYANILNQEGGFNTNYVEATAKMRNNMLRDFEKLLALKKLEDKGYDKRQELEDKYGANWDKHIPKGYSIFDPLSGDFITSANSLQDEVLDWAFYKAMEPLGMTKEAMNKIRSKVQGDIKTRSMVMPTEIVKTLESIITPVEDRPFTKFVQALTSPWKKYVLYFPTRFWKYNARNITGDLDAVLAGNPMAILSVPKAMKELYTAYYGDPSKVSQELREFQARGGALTVQSVQELNDYREMKKFKALIDELSGKEESSLKDLPKKTLNLLDKVFWSGIQNFSDFREQWLRYATYLDYLQQMQKNNGVPRNFGASVKEEVMAIDDIRDRAFKLANELLGDYDQISESGKQLRKALIPFYSWMEVNAKRYAQLIKNGLTEDDFLTAKLPQLFASQIPGLAYRIPKTLFLINFFNLLIQAFNHFLFGNDEKKLPPEIAASSHITLGHDDKGNIRYFTQVGAFTDVLEWFAADTFMYDAKRIIKRQESVTDWLGRFAKAPLNKVFNGLSPFIKTPIEVGSGFSFYPDFTNPRPMQDRLQGIAQSFGLSWPYKMITGKPHNNWEEFKNLFIYKQNADYAAYNYIKGLVRQYKEDKLGQKGGFATDTARSNAIRTFKNAVRLDDKETAKKAIGIYFREGGTYSSAKKSLENNMHPLSALSEKYRQAFLKTLSDEDMKFYRRAEKYHTDFMKKYHDFMK